MNISILDLHGQYRTIKGEVNKAMRKVVDSQHFILGKELELFEKEMASYCDTGYAVGVASGTDALLLSLMALDITRGDEVITTPYTYVATAEVIALLGATPVFVDIDPRTYTINPDLIRAKVTRRTKAIIPVHLYGQCADMDPIIAIAKEYGLKIVEDCAQAIGARYKGRKSGSMGDLGALSFFPSKNLGAYGDGGMVVTHSKELAEKLKVLRFHGSRVRYMHAVIGTNSRLDNIQAAVLRVKLKYLDRWLEARRQHAAYYNERLDLPQLTLPYVPGYNVHTYHLYVIKVTQDLERFMKFLIRSGIETRTYYPGPLHVQECFRHLKYKRWDMKESVDAAAHTCALPVYPELKKSERGYVVKKIREFFGA